MRRTQWLVAAIVIAAGVVNSVIAATFTSLGNLGGGVIPNSFAFGVSGDGSVIVGNSTSPLGGGAYRWDAVNGMVRIDGETEVGDYSRARAANFDGSIVVGTSYSLPGSFRWDAVNGMVALGGGEALGISDDGEVIVGQASGEAFRWDAINGMVGLGHIAGGSRPQGGAISVNGDGSVIVGYDSGGSNASKAFRWTADTGMLGLGTLRSDGEGFSRGLDVSTDGLVVVGSSDNDEGVLEAFRWDAINGMVGLGDVDGINIVGNSIAYGVSDDGSVIVGSYSPTPVSDPYSIQAFVWNVNTGARNLKDVLVNSGVDLTGWYLGGAEDVSADGHVIVGWGFNPGGYPEAWMVTMPEPGSVGLLGVAGVGMLGRKCRMSNSE